MNLPLARQGSLEFPPHPTFRLAPGSQDVGCDIGVLQHQRLVVFRRNLPCEQELITKFNLKIIVRQFDRPCSAHGKES